MLGLILLICGIVLLAKGEITVTKRRVLKGQSVRLLGGLYLIAALAPNAAGLIAPHSLEGSVMTTTIVFFAGLFVCLIATLALAIFGGRSKPFCQSLRSSQGDVVGLWVENPGDPNLKTYVAALNKKEALPADLYSTFLAGQYRVVTHPFDMNGGSFLMFGRALAPGEAIPPKVNQTPPIPRRSASPDVFKFSCPTCGQRISATREAVGTSGVCPGCSNDVTVPDL